MNQVQRAVLSVTDKTGIVELARALVELGIEILSTGGTEAVLRDAGLPVRSIAEETGSPEMLGGRVKTLHPKLLGGVLARRDHPGDARDLEANGIRTVDLVVVNLYAFEQTVSRPDVGLAEAIEHIDVGGPTLIRSAAKNWASVGVVTDPADYPTVVRELREHDRRLSDETRLKLAYKAFTRTAAYDAAISVWLQGPAGVEGFPERLVLSFDRIQTLRYGENPHQTAAFYADPAWKGGSSLARARQHGGKELSYNNLLDLDAALRIVADLSGQAAVIIKHGNPAGVSEDRETLREAFDLALAGDTLSAFGGVIGLSRRVDLATARGISPHFFEAVLAPGYDEDALELLTRKKNLRVLELDALQAPPASAREIRRVAGGLLMQSWDREPLPQTWNVVSVRQPTGAELHALKFAWKVVEHVKSNAIVFANEGQVVGVGAGQMSRVDSVTIAARKAGDRSRGAVMASDAFFPFADGVEAAAKAGITAVVQPGGSLRDDEVRKAADEAGLAMIFTGVRHFRH
jgi:phosphoribosylaminoimidazolecarboxamide formyltransferase/IMP cyclohydrolase